MPYKSNEEAKGVKGTEGYSDHQITIFRKAFNSALAMKLKAGVEKSKAESYAFAVAHAAAKKAGKAKNEGACSECGQNPCICSEVDEIMRGLNKDEEEPAKSKMERVKLEGVCTSITMTKWDGKTKKLEGQNLTIEMDEESWKTRILDGGKLLAILGGYDMAEFTYK